ncbi:unnamed protein product, partial [Durusdinium trenchii]
VAMVAVEAVAGQWKLLEHRWAPVGALVGDRHELRYGAKNGWSECILVAALDKVSVEVDRAAPRTLADSAKLAA